MIVNTATVLRDGSEQEIPIDEIVVGDVVKLSAGDMIPADVVFFTRFSKPDKIGRAHV